MRRNGAVWTRRSQFLDDQLQIETDDCVEWPYALSQGYGAIRADGKLVRVHVIACEREHGPRPTPNHQAAHSCGNHACFNRRHVRWTTQSVNEADKISHGRSNHGSRNGMSKLSERDVIEIRTMLFAGVLQREIAAKFNINQATVSNIKTKDRWRHL